MYEKNKTCSSCGKSYPLSKKIFLCECGSTLEIIFDYKKLRKVKTLLKSRPFNHARYKEFYPVKKLLSIQEGGTPLVKSRSGELYFKNEALNPTGSFKDRGSSVEVAKALESRARRVVCASTGNMGASVSAYSSLAGIECHVFTPRDAKIVKLEQMLAYGSKVYKVRGNYSTTEKAVYNIYRKGRAYLLGDYLYRREGTKSVGFELAEQIDADYIFAPVGNGTLVSALWKAYSEFKTIGIVKKLPRIVGIQAKTCSPLVKAYRSGSAIKSVCGKTVAVAIECGDPIDGKGVLKAVKSSRGFLSAVSDSEILKARELLARKEGIFAEPAGAAAFSGYLKNKNKVRGKIVCLVTGHGLKTPFTGVRGKPIHITLKQAENTLR
jgi:threonine synthase